MRNYITIQNKYHLLNTQYEEHASGARYLYAIYYANEYLVRRVLSLRTYLCDQSLLS